MFSLSKVCARANIQNGLRCFSKERAGKSIKPNAVLVINDQPHKVVKFNQGKRGKGGGFVRATLKSLVGNSQFERTFTSDEIVEHADLENIKATYSWNDGERYYFMNANTFEEIAVMKDDIDTKYLLEGMEVKMVMFGDKIIGVDLPVSYNFTVTKVGAEIPNTQGREQWVTLETGAEVKASTNVQVGTVVKMHIEEDRYIGRV